ncbi:MAG: hypothetical protein A2138_24970 [Deltaproteobacteria bacterium RBG_16_71_12]|nr:MAG: hypothetical protein A2138_24970 [Deltaproteobacteria bacterium RBG_16_71_12]
MSLDVVSKRIEVLSQKKLAKEEDAVDVIVAAERSLKGRSDGVSNAEARAVADLYLRSRAPTPSTKLQAPVLEDGAVKKLEAFFIAHNLPYGTNKGPMKDRILAALAGRQLGEPMARAPRTGSLQPLRLSRADEERRDAYLDVVKKQFVVRIGEGAQATFYGPFPLE